jgi:hypothetical protein
MAEFILFLVIFVGIMAVSALVFGGWFLVMIARGIAAFLGVRPARVPPQMPAGPQQGPYGFRRPSGAVQTGPVAGHRVCAYELCKAENDASARFCRRCGRQLAAPARVRVTRAAVW